MESKMVISGIAQCGCSRYGALGHYESPNLGMYASESFLANPGDVTLWNNKTKCKRNKGLVYHLN